MYSCNASVNKSVEYKDCCPTDNPSVGNVVSVISKNELGRISQVVDNFGETLYVVDLIREGGSGGCTMTVAKSDIILCWCKHE